MMYIHSGKEKNGKRSICVTRADNEIVFKTATKCTGKYQNSPFHKGTQMWNVLNEDVQKSCNVLRFTTSLKTLYDGYQEIW